MSGKNSHGNRDGSIHETYYTNNNARYSRDRYPDGTCKNRHMTDQDDNEHLNFPDCDKNNDDMWPN